MSRYLVRRLLTAIPTLLLISFVLYAILSLAPGDPLSQFAANPAVPPEVRDNIHEVRKAELDRIRPRVAVAERLHASPGPPSRAEGEQSCLDGVSCDQKLGWVGVLRFAAECSAGAGARAERIGCEGRR